MNGQVDLKAIFGVEEWQLDIGIGLGMLLWFCLCYPLSKTEKQRAWILTFLNATLCIVAGLYTLHYELHWKFHVDEHMLTESNLSRFMVRFFRAATVLDILIGLVAYPSQLELLTGYIHHSAYFLLCNWMLKRNVSFLFSICLLEELPTLLMGIGKAYPPWRLDTAFGVSYGLLRVLLHTLLNYHVFTYSGSNDRINVVRFNFGLTWLLHVYWFSLWIRQQVRLAKQRKHKQ